MRAHKILPKASMPRGLPGMGLRPGVVLVPGVGASLRGVGVLDFRPGVEDLSFWVMEEESESELKVKQKKKTDATQKEGLPSLSS